MYCPIFIVTDLANLNSLWSDRQWTYQYMEVDWNLFAYFIDIKHGLSLKYSELIFTPRLSFDNIVVLSDKNCKIIKLLYIKIVPQNSSYIRFINLKQLHCFDFHQRSYFYIFLSIMRQLGASITFLYIIIVNCIKIYSSSLL